MEVWVVLQRRVPLKFLVTRVPYEFWDLKRGASVRGLPFLAGSSLNPKP